MSPENQRRAQHGLSTLAHHLEDGSIARVGSEIDYLEVADLLTDIRHLCLWKNVEFDWAVDYSKEHFLEELTGEWDEPELE